VNARYSGSKVAENTLLMNPYKIILNDSNGHGCYFEKYQYSNMWIIHIQSSTNLPKCMWKLIFNVANVIFWFKSLERKTCKVQRNNAPPKTFKNICFWDNFFQKQTKIATHMDLWKYGQILTIQKSLTFQKKYSSYEFIFLHYIIYWVPITNFECESI